MRKITLLFILVLYQITGFSQGVATGTQFFTTGTAPVIATISNSAVKACAAWSVAVLAANPTKSAVGGPVVNGLSCAVQMCITASCVPVTYTTATSAIGAQSGPVALDCPAAGEVKTQNFTLGFTEDPQGGKAASVETFSSVFGSMLASGSACVSGGGATCSVAMVNNPANLGNGWISASPNAQGLYRVSQDFKVTHTGNACTPTANEKMATESTNAAASCAGVYGTVNGKGVCVPSSTANRNVISNGVGTAPRYVGNPTAGSNGALPLASRMPSAGTGNNDGGPATPVDGVASPAGSPLPTSATSVGSSSGSGITPGDLANIKTDCDKYPTSFGCLPLGSASSQALSTVPLSSALYKPVYTDGPAGVWNTKVAAIKATPLFNVASNLMPSVAVTGACPTFVIPLNVGIGNFGSHDFAPPCWIWDFGKFVIVVSALLLARSLVFGG